MNRTHAARAAAAMLLVWLWSAAAALADEPLRFDVRLDPEVAKAPITGRLYVFTSPARGLFSRVQRQPRFGPNWFRPEPFFRVDVQDFAPGTNRTVDGRADGFPASLGKLKAGRYRVQALLDHDFYNPSPGTGPGNFYSDVRSLDLAPGTSGKVELVLRHVVEAREFPESRWVKEVALRSPVLSKFHGREVIERAAVVLPASYYDEPRRRYPAMYVIPGFGGSHLGLARGYLSGTPKPAEGEVEFVRVLLSGRCKWGHHVYADSATNGPRGECLVREMIPQIDRQFRTIAEPTARFVTGHSSGGWSSLWLQVRYPDTFGGVWSIAPDPVDFRDFSGVDVYADPPQSFFRDAQGARRPIARRGTTPVLWLEPFCRMDDVLARGGQLRSFEAVFSLRGPDGLPQRLWDRASGRIDPEVARAWRKYDIRLLLEEGWPELGPKLGGKLHVVTGELDTFYLEGAAKLLAESLRRLGSDAVVEIVPGADHGSVLRGNLHGKIRRQMSEAFLKHHPDHKPPAGETTGSSTSAMPTSARLARALVPGVPPPNGLAGFGEFTLGETSEVCETSEVSSETPRAEQRIQYPDTRRDDQVDVYHGVKVADPYRWLETDVRRSKEVADWVAAENKVTFAYLESIPRRDAIRRRLTELWDYERYSSPFKEGGRYFYLKNDGLQNQSVLYTMDSLEGKARVLIDPNAWSRDGTVALTGLAVSWDGRYVAYGVAEAGSDWHTWRVMEIATGKVLSDELKWIKFSGAAWTHDGKGFFYSLFDEPKAGARYHALNLNQKLCYHRLGMPQSDDVLVYHRPDEPTWGYSGDVTQDGRYLVISVRKGTDRRNRVTVKDLAEPYGMPVDVIDNFDHEYTCIGNDGPVFYFKTDLDAPRKRLVSIDLRPEPPGLSRRPAERGDEPPEPPGLSRRQAERGDEPRGSSGSPAAPKEIIPQAEETLVRVSLVGNLFIASYLKDATTLVRIYTTAGRPVRDVKLPGIGTASGFGGRRTDTETFYSFSSFATPPSIYRYDLITGTSTLLRRAKVKFDPDQYEVKQVFYHSKDGTRVPMFITHKKGIEPDGNRPTLLYGYGGFAIPLTPRFSVSRVAWMEMGGVFAVANLRGGGEYGEAWHKAGTKLRKQNVFDDFLAAAEWLVANRYTRPERLAIQGGSNGGLLVGAVMTQRPKLFGACLPAVGVMDMLRFHKFTAGRYWVDDYGSSDDPEEFKALMAYSPFHNVKPGTAYPATLITTADTDDRVVPGHSFKFAAALQHAQAGPAPVLIRIETRAGHGAGKPTTKRIDETADQLAFLVKSLGME